MARRNNIGSFGGLYGGDARGLYSSSSHRNMMIYGKPPRRWPKVLLAIAIVVIVVCCIWQFACGGLPFLQAQEDEDQAQPASAQQAVEQTASAASAMASADSSEHGTYQAGLNTQITVSAVGDCTLGADEDFDEDTSLPTVYNEQGAKYFFSLVKKYTKADDLTLANLEGPLTTSSDAQNASFNFKGAPAYANILRRGSVEAVSLANDHSYDYGEDGYEDTKENLAKYKVSSFGYDRTATVEVNGVKVGLYGVNQVTSTDTARQQMQQDVASLKEGGCALIVGMFHWGVEGSHSTESEQVELAHEAIDEGTDLVIGSHPHVLQGIELYKDRYICYSVGNFVFGGNDQPKETNTMIFQQTFTIQDGLLAVDDGNVKSADVVPCTISSSTTVNNYQPRPLMGDNAGKLLKAINRYSSKLSGDGVTLQTALDDDGRAQVG